MEHFNTINRIAILVYPKKPFINWLKYVDLDVPLFDDIRIYDFALSKEDIKNIYNQGDVSEEINPLTWTKVQQGVTGQTDKTSWIDDGSETSPPPDNEGVINRFYKVGFDN